MSLDDPPSLQTPPPQPSGGLEVRACVCVCMCVHAHARARVRVCACVRARGKRLLPLVLSLGPCCRKRVRPGPSSAIPLSSRWAKSISTIS